MGVELVAAALRGCAMSIDGNLAGMADAAYVERARTERQQLEADGLADSDRARALLSPGGR
jgi:formiminotetrahydrofolate cyclodeaminase